MTHTISLIVENHQGVMSRISGLFSGRGYNLESITAGANIDQSTSTITLVCKGDDQIIEQIKSQLSKLIDVIQLTDLTNVPAVSRELALIKVKADASDRHQIIQTADVFKARILDVSRSAVILELCASCEKIDDFILLVGEENILETARSGLVGMKREDKHKDSQNG